MMPYRIRTFAEGDAEALHELSLAAISVVGPSAYSQEQIAAWSARHRPTQGLADRAASGHAIFIAADADNVPVAFALLEPDGHLDQLYCHPQHTKRGLAYAVLRAAEDRALISGIAKLYTEASELARPAFERAGYVMLYRREFDIDGVSIHNYAMEKPLL